MIISSSEMVFYDVWDFVEANDGGVLINPFDPIWKTLPNGVYWSNMRLSCSTQAVVIVKDGETGVDRWDKTFHAKAAILK